MSDALPRAPRYDSLDFWRGLACLFVVLYHSVLLFLASPARLESPTTGRVLDVFGGLWIGVPMFFVISGYCIAASADRHRRKGHALRTYFWRRFRRIYPPLWAVIVLSVGFFFLADVWLWPRLLSTEPWLQPRPWWYSGWEWIGNLTLTETWRHHLIGGPRAHFPGQAWTLCYEEQFYAVIGLLLLFPQFLFRGTVIVSVLTASVMVWAQREGWDISGFFFDGNWLTFASGVLVYYALNYGSVRFQQAAGVGLAFCGVWAAGWPVHGAAWALEFAVLLLLLKPFDQALASFWLLRPVVICGQMCYSLYLVHQLLVRATAALLARAGMESGIATLFVTVPTCVVISAVAGWAFHVGVERRFLNGPSERQNEARASAAVAIA